MEKAEDIDIYDLLNIPITADERQIKKAYRKKALTCHPDKNPDNPRAAALFLQLSEALEILLDKTKKDAYDKAYNAKKAAKIRHDALDARRKKFKEDLEMKERLAQTENAKFKTARKDLNAEIERLRKEGSQQLKEEMESIRQQILKETLSQTKQNDAADGGLFRLKIKWKSDKNDPNNGGYDAENLSKIFSKYGDISVLVVSQKKKGSGLIEFEKGESALQAYQLESGLPENPLTLSWLNGEPPSSKTSGTSLFNSSRINKNNPTEPSNGTSCLFPSMNHSYSNVESKKSTNSSVNDETDFEALVFAKLREAEENKRSNKK
ncbi:hypothetical protein O3M35_003211 [Rhynocoris fuscipes]|uniref:J domain-containing protein n=1 Tax=Rhynocoris fuscipes TaxID=488301 RepID=A0AAW1CP86_9HEMI